MNIRKHHTSRLFILSLLLTASVVGCSSKSSPLPADSTGSQQVGLTESQGLPQTDLPDSGAVSDPLEPVNRKIHSFNESVDKAFIGPVSRGYNAVLPWWAKKGVQNFFRNIRFPIYFVSDVIQGKVTQAGEHTARFVVNTTAGIVGLIDVANEVGLPHHEEDLGTALGYHGVGPGPYIVIPILGPSNVRDIFGMLIDQFLNPLSYTEIEIQAGARVLDGIDTRRRLEDAIDLGRESSLDYYLYLQSSYQQYREGLIHDKGAGTPFGPAEQSGGALDADPFVGEESGSEMTPPAASSPGK